jgi:5'(3')-deoxyribonucleotidase
MRYNISLDVDGVLAGFQSAVIDRARAMGLDFYDHYSLWNHWMVHEGRKEAFDQVAKTIDGSREFWLEEVRPLPEAHVPYEVEAYVSARRGVPEGVTEKWLRENNFPEAPVHIVDDGEEKAEVLRSETNTDVFVDDKISTIKTLQDHWTPENGVPYPILFNQPHNSRHSRSSRISPWAPRAYYLPEVPKVAHDRLSTYE